MQIQIIKIGQMKNEIQALSYCYDNGGSQRDRGQIFVFHHNAATAATAAACIIRRLRRAYLS